MRGLVKLVHNKRQKEWEHRNYEQHRNNQLRWRSENLESYKAAKLLGIFVIKTVCDQAKQFAKDNPGWKRSATANAEHRN